MSHTHYINSTLKNGSHYEKGCFAPPMKELNEQTVLVENSRENKNGSCRQKTKIQKCGKLNERAFYRQLERSR